MDEQTILLLAVSGCLLLLIALIVAALLIRRTITATIEGFYWFRKIFFEHYIWVQDSSYWGFPSGSRNQYKKTESYQAYEVIRHDTITTQQNGVTTTTTQPVYGFVAHFRTKYFYEIEKWVRSRELEAEGTERSTLHWPAYRLDQNTQERIEDTAEKYMVIFRSSKGKIYRRRLSEMDWIALDEQATYTLKVNLFGRIKLISLNAAQVVSQPQQTP